MKLILLCLLHEKEQHDVRRRVDATMDAMQVTQQYRYRFYSTITCTMSTSEIGYS